MTNAWQEHPTWKMRVAHAYKAVRESLFGRRTPQQEHVEDIVYAGKRQMRLRRVLESKNRWYRRTLILERKIKRMRGMVVSAREDAKKSREDSIRREKIIQARLERSRKAREYLCTADYWTDQMRGWTLGDRGHYCQSAVKKSVKAARKCL